jgi:transposase-like protein
VSISASGLGAGADGARRSKAGSSRDPMRSEQSRRHDTTPQHLFAWRKAARAGRLTLPVEEAPVFVPVVPAIPRGRRGGRVSERDCIDRDRDCGGSGSKWFARKEVLATKPVDFRRGADSLAALVRGDDLHLPVEAGEPPENPGLGRVRPGAVLETA